MVGGLVYVHRPDDVVVVRRAPRREAEFTVAQKCNQRRFAAATLYVKRLKANPEEYAPYRLAAKIQRKRPCDLAMRDALNQPVVNDIDLSAYTGKAGEIICVHASDDFGVAAVRLTLSQLPGLLLEQGTAVVQESSSKWLYLTQVAVLGAPVIVIQVTAIDRPGNLVTKTVHHALLGAS